MLLDWKPPHTLASLAGYAGGAFLIGIAWHSLRPYQPVGMAAISALTAGATIIVLSFWKQPWGRLVGICLVAFMLGLWRFDVAIPNLPAKLVPFSSKGLASVSDVSPTDDADPRYWLTRGKTSLTVRTAQIFPEPEAALLTGILYGNPALPTDLKDDLRRAGLIHIVAVSGWKLTVIVVLLMHTLLACRLPRRTAFGALTVAILAFVLFVSPHAAVVRAAVMGWLIELAPLVGRIPRPSRLLLISAVIFTVWQPWALLFDAGFAMSCLAMWGIMTWGARLQAWLEKKIAWRNFASIISVTVGATLMTAPYAAWAFGQLTLWGFFTNLLAMPLMTWTLCSGLIALLLPAAVNIARLPTLGFLKLILWTARLPAQVGVGYWSKLSTPFTYMLTAYIFIFLFWGLIKPNKPLIHHFSD